MSPIKEPKFFLTDDAPPPRTGGPGDARTYREHVWRRDAYEKLFEPAPPGAKKGESTPLYLDDPDAMARVSRLIPDAKIIAVIRDPVERAHSNWTHLWSAGLEPESDFLRACEDEERRKAQGWASFWHYTGLSMYGRQLEHAFGLFPRDGILVLRYRALVDEPARTLDRICAFLDVDQGKITEIPRANVTAHPEHTLVHRAASLAMRAAEGAGRWLPGDAVTHGAHPLERFLQRGNRERQPLSWDQRQALLPAFADDVELLQRLLREDFSDWLAPRERSVGMVGARPAGQGQAKNGRPRKASEARSPVRATRPPA
jgi:hypothetical protein